MNFLAIVWVMAAAPVDGGSPTVLELMKNEAKGYSAQVKSPWVKQFLTATASLPSQPKRVFFHTADKSRYFTDADAAKLPEAERAALVKREVDDEVYYGRITEPMGYARPFDVLAAQGFSPKGKKVLDFGYGNIGQLKALVALGAEVSGIEVDPLLPLLYAKENSKRLHIFHGFFPSDATLVKDVGRGYDLFVSKNTLKKGYIHPDRAITPEQEKRQIKLNVTDDEFVATVFALLNPGGYAYVYNITPAPSPADKPFVPWSDGRSPFTKETWEKAGFEVIAFDVDDSPGVRAMGKAFGWDVPQGGEPGSDLEKDLFATYTLVRKPMARTR